MILVADPRRGLAGISIPNVMTDEILTPHERQALDAFAVAKREDEMAHAKKLFEGTRSRLRIARAYSECISESEETKALIHASFSSITRPPGTSPALYRAVIEVSDRIVEDKLQFIQIMFEMTFGVSIFKYLRSGATASRRFGSFG